MNVPRNSIAPPKRNGASSAPFLTRPRVRRWLLMILILWLALFLRVWQLDTIPPGLHYDEAFNGTMARDVLRGINRPMFFTPNFGEEPLHIYTEALLFAFLGESPWTIRFVSAIFGVIFVAAIYACARAFFPRSALTALAASFIAATLYWAINFSRIGIETNGLPMVLTWSAAALAHAFRKMTWRWIFGAGFLIGATIYTYLASRLWLLAVFLWFIYLFVLHRTTIRAYFSKWVALAFFTLLTLAPLILFFAANPVAFTGRSGTVFTPEIFFTNLARTAGMFFFVGDSDPRDNFPARPALDILLAAFFVVGLLISLARFRKPFYGLVLIWFVVMCLPSALTEFAPNFRRAIGAMPAMILLCALGVEWIWNRLSALHAPRSTLQIIARLALLAALALSAFWSARAYFVEWASGTGLFYSFDAGLLQVGNALAARPPNEDLYLTPDYAEHYTIIWALDGRAVSSFDGREIFVSPQLGIIGTYGIITREDSFSSDRLNDSPVSTLLETFYDREQKPYAEIITFPTIMEQAPGKEFATQVGNFARVTGRVIKPRALKRGDELEIRLGWEVRQEVADNFTVFMQLVGPPNPATNSPVWAQQDKQPGNGTYRTSEWRADQRISESFHLKIPPEAIAGNYSIQMGMYLFETGERVPLRAPDGTRIENDALTLDSIVLP